MASSRQPDMRLYAMHLRTFTHLNIAPCESPGGQPGERALPSLRLSVRLQSDGSG
jgi:hypothetical protein